MICFSFILAFLPFASLSFVPSCKYYIDTNITIFMSTLEGPEAWNSLSCCAIPDGRARVPWEGGPS